MTLPKFPFEVCLPDTQEVHKTLWKMNIIENIPSLLSPHRIMVLRKGYEEYGKPTVKVQHPTDKGVTYWMWTDFIEKYYRPHTLNELVIK